MRLDSSSIGKDFCFSGGAFPSHAKRVVQMAHCLALLSSKPDGLLRQNRFTLNHLPSRPPYVPN
jgi:hypothetical protein